MFIAFLPYTTDVLAVRLVSGTEMLPATVLYGSTMVAIAIMFNVIWAYAASRNGRLLHQGIEDQILRVGARGYQFAPVGYLVITALALINPYLSLAGYAAYAVYSALPVSGPVTTVD